MAIGHSAIRHSAIGILAIGHSAIGILAIGHLAVGILAIGHSAIGISAININWQSSIIIGVIFLCVSFQFTTSPLMLVHGTAWTVKSV